ncbi:hypothetical protein NDU88_005736 [Pleurodeles waltl]|uniref:Uncharacterized protein n=1 Tax=Pleurodeles waltl TaxID=8319 RepID=A0AAV7PNJ8_PLEWA|nr:hypothetical protein NDU88_005736 [Pleurodeles waltl]
MIDLLWFKPLDHENINIFIWKEQEKQRAKGYIAEKYTDKQGRMGRGKLEKLRARTYEEKNCATRRAVLVCNNKGTDPLPCGTGFSRSIKNDSSPSVTSSGKVLYFVTAGNRTASGIPQELNYGDPKRP